MSMQRTPPGKRNTRGRPADESASSGEEEERSQAPETSGTADPAGARRPTEEFEDEEHSDVDPESEIFDGVELNPEDYPELRPVGTDYIYRYVRDGRHIPSSRTDHFGVRHEVVIKLQGMPGYAVRVPARFTTPKFCRFFTCGAFSKKEPIAEGDPLTTIGHLSDRVSNVERLAEEKRLREERERQRTEVQDRPETTPKITDAERITGGGVSS